MTPRLRWCLLPVVTVAVVEVVAAAAAEVVAGCRCRPYSGAPLTSCHWSLLPVVGEVVVVVVVEEEEEEVVVVVEARWCRPCLCQWPRLVVPPSPVQVASWGGRRTAVQGGARVPATPHTTHTTAAVSSCPCMHTTLTHAAVATAQAGTAVAPVAVPVTAT